MLGFGEVRSDVKPPSWEDEIMKPAVRATVKRRASGIVNPVSLTKEAFIAGGKLYLAGCTGCHGDLGKPLGEDANEYPPAPQLPRVGTQYSEPELYWIIKHGVRMTAMSAYGPFYSEQQLWDLAIFVRGLTNLQSSDLAAIQAK
jgi:mono/diheme cytochrome c family protein